MKTLALEILAEIQQSFEDPGASLHYVSLRVRSINAVPCRAHLLLQRDGWTCLEVVPNRIAYFDEYGDPANLVYFRKRFENRESPPRYTPTELERILLETRDILASLKFNRMEGRFQLIAPGIKDLESFSCENVCMDLNPCRSCGEPTACKTSCACRAQHLCFVCWDKIAPVREERFGDFINLQRCPGCGEELAFSRCPQNK